MTEGPTPVASAVKPRRGRPADQDLAPRVYREALEIYAEVGWAGFSFDLVARRARVGKAALYGRWGSKEALIIDALSNRLRPEPVPFDTGSIRTDLIALARDVLGSFVRLDGLIMLRAQVEAKFYPEVLGRAIEEWQRRDTSEFRQMTLRAIERGELPKGTSPSLVLDALIGILANRALWTPAARMQEMDRGSDAYVARVVDFVLAGLRATSVPRSIEPTRLPSQA
jgi:AcrR family transcriptional regulator